MKGNNLSQSLYQRPKKKEVLAAAPSRKTAHRWPLILVGSIASFLLVSCASHNNDRFQIDLESELLTSGELATPSTDASDAALTQALMPRLEIPPLSGEPMLATAGSQSVNSRSASNYRGDEQARVDISVRDMSANEFFLGLMRNSGQNIVATPGITGSITLSLGNVTVEETLQAVEDVYGIGWERQAYGYRVSPIDLQVQVFQLDYLNLQRSGSSQTRVSSGQVSDRDRREFESGEEGSRRDSRDESNGTSGSRIETRSETDLWAEMRYSIEQLISGKPGRSVTMNPQAGLLIVRAMPAELRAVASYLDQAQSALHRQVILEAKVIEVELSDDYQAGINWAALGNPGNGTLTVAQTGGGTILGNGRSILQGNAGSLNPMAGVLPDGTATSAFGGVFSAALKFKDFAAFIELLETQGDVQVLSSPRVSTVNNQKAIIKVGSDEFFVTDISTTTVTSGSSQTVSPDIELTPFFSGIALDVTPQIGARDDITLHIHPTVSEVRDGAKRISIGGEEQTVPLAVSTIRESDSVIRARSGQMVVIGGLMQSSVDNRKAGLPWAASLPGVGSLFRQEARVARKKELVILLRPIVINDDNWDAPLRETQSRLSNIRQLGQQR